eukprot:g71150.t1
MVEAYHGQDKIINFVQGIADGRVADALGPKLGHVDLRCAIVNQKVEAGLVVNEKVGSNDNLANINTKAMRGEPYNRRVRHVAKD